MSSYSFCAASATDKPIGDNKIGTLLKRLIVTVNTALTSAVTLKDGSVSLAIVPNAFGLGVGTYVIEIGARSAAGGWTLTTGAGSTVLAVYERSKSAT